MINRATMLTTSEAAAFLRLSTRTILIWIHEGKLNSVRIGRRYLISRCQIEDLMRMPNASTSTPPTTSSP